MHYVYYVYYVYYAYYVCFINIWADSWDMVDEGSIFYDGMLSVHPQLDTFLARHIYTFILNKSAIWRDN